MSTPKYINNFVVLSKTELSKLSQKDRIAYEDSLKYYRDLHNSLNYAGEEDLEKGIEKGEKQKAIKVVEKSVQEGLSFDIISTITGLSIEEIKEIATSLKK